MNWQWTAAPLLLTPIALLAPGSEDAPPAVAALLVEHLAGAWAAALAEDRTAELPEELRRYAAAGAGLPKKAQARLERSVAAPLLERIDDRTAPKRLRKQARELLQS